METPERHSLPDPVPPNLPPYELPEDYEAQIARGLNDLNLLPRDANWEMSRQVLENAPSRETIEAANRQATDARALLEAFNAARYNAADPDGLARVTIDAKGRVWTIEFTFAVAERGSQAIIEALRAARVRAEQVRAEDAERFNEWSNRLGQP